MKKILLLAAMTAAFLVVSIILLGILVTLAVVIAMVVVAPFAVFTIMMRRKTPPTPSPATGTPKKFGWGWIVIVVAIVVLCALGLWWKHCENKESQDIAVRQRVAQELARREAVRPTVLREYEYSKEDYPGQNNGNDPRYNPPKPTGRAFLITDSPEAMTFRVEYTEDGKLRTVLFTLDKTLPEKVGVWNQEEPRFSGKWFLKDKQMISNGYCFCINMDARPELGWHDAYLTPK